MRTFVTVFPNTTLWHGGSLMIGSTRPLVIEEKAFMRKQTSPQSKEALDGMGFKTFESLLSQYDAGPAEIKAFLGAGTDFDRRPAPHGIFPVAAAERQARGCVKSSRQRLASRDRRFTVRELTCAGCQEISSDRRAHGEPWNSNHVTPSTTMSYRNP